jgi:hypothetical protein
VVHAVRTAARGEVGEVNWAPGVLLGVLGLVLVWIARQHWGVLQAWGRQLHRGKTEVQTPSRRTDSLGRT